MRKYHMQKLRYFLVVPLKVIRPVLVYINKHILKMEPLLYIKNLMDKNITYYLFLRLCSHGTKIISSRNIIQ